MKNDVRLVCQQGGHNKYYEMKQIDDNTFIVLWGRIGASPQETMYPIEGWNKKYKEKLAKGYIDVSEKKMSLEDIFAELDALEARMNA